MTHEPAAAPPIAIVNDDAEVDQHSGDDDDETLCARCSRTTNDPVAVGDDDWCESCADDFSNVCEGCGDRLHVDSLRYDLNDEPYCESCESDGRWETDDNLTDGETIFDHDVNIAHVLNLDLDEGTLYLGFEIELDTQTSERRWAAARAFLRHHSDLGIVKHDGSIGDGESGLEFVSRPFAHIDCRNAVTALLSNDDVMHGLTADQTCGMHVHVSRAPLSTCTLLRLACFVNNPANTAFLEHLAGRPLTTSRWATLLPGTTWRSFYAPDQRVKVWHYERYLALNLTNVATVEFRLFASTTDPQRARANLDACAALVAFCATAARDRASALSAGAFLDYACANRRSFPDLAAFLSPSRVTTQAA